jgi:hypothetical protein
MTETAVEDIITRMAAAELAGDHAALEELIAEDFRLVGPLRFVLEKAEWLEQYRAGHLTSSRVAIKDRAARTRKGITVRRWFVCHAAASSARALRGFRAAAAMLARCWTPRRCAN